MFFLLHLFAPALSALPGHVVRVEMLAALAIIFEKPIYILIASLIRLGTVHDLNRIQEQLGDGLLCSPVPCLLQPVFSVECVSDTSSNCNRRIPHCRISPRSHQRVLALCPGNDLTPLQEYRSL
ncbi:hypothetical protein B0H17DRAFT_1260841 [Mycena rosella]|uniref:Uncharacterized protein n=1 Tax=Mycena rosella TaxID=1033263 RepID=A0AAD7CR38_MYCRO|nr:hypothetical protein B0H17DRAFT_1260841 [Mycena rosella]